MPGPEPADTALDLLRYVQMTPYPFAKVDDVNKHTSVGYKQTRNRLDELESDGYLNVRKVGNVNLYWLSDKGSSRLRDN